MTDDRHPEPGPEDIRAEHGALPEAGHGGEADRLLADTFAAFRDSHRAQFQPPPLATIVARAGQHRLRYRTAVAAAAALLLVTGTGAAVALVTGERPQRGAEHGAAASQTPDLSESPRSHSQPDPDDTKPPTKRTVDPHTVDLANATIRLPAVAGCSGGVLAFTDGAGTDSGGCDWQISPPRARYGDLDGAAGDEIVTTVVAGDTTAVVGLRVLSRTELNGMGYPVVAEDGQSIESISLGRNGSISVGISNPSVAGPRAEQTRTYRWSGGGFSQIGGPTGFPDGGSEPSSSPSASTSSPIDD